MSWQAKALNTWLLRTERPHMAKATPRQLRRSFLLKSRMFFWGPKGMRATASHEGRVPVLNVSGPWAPEHRVLYFHGGGYVFGAPETHVAMISNLCKRAKATAILPRYRLAPEHSFPAAFEDAVAAYTACPRDLPIWIGGDSAGGGLALALLSHILTEGLPPPAGLFAFAPLVDLRYAAPSISENAQSDVVLPAERIPDFVANVLQGAPPEDPRISPIFARFPECPPVHIWASTTEILRDDAINIREHLKNEGAHVELTLEENLPHVWPLFHNILPEATQTLAQVARWITSRPG